MQVKISSIKIDRSAENTKRFRTDMGDIQEMVESLAMYGLIQPIVVDELKGDEKYLYTLAAGERRLTAALYLGWTMIEATVREELSDLERKELELEENIRRKDLTWIERVEALRQLDELRRATYGSRLPGSIGNEGWTIQDTARSVGASLGKVSQDIKLACDLKKHPELLKKIGNLPKTTARKIVEREMMTIRVRDQVERKEILLTSDLILGKAEKEIKNIRSKSVHCWITDPPYAVPEINKVEEGGLTGKYDRGTNVGDEADMTIVYQELLPEMNRVMVPGAHFYMFFGIEWRDRLIEVFEKNGFIVHGLPLVWPKHRTSMIPNPYHYIPSYETILFGCKAPQCRILMKPRSNCLLEFPADSPQIRVHPLQKPLDLIKMFIENSTVFGETVIDTFAGSGVTLKAAKELGRRGIGFEKDETNFYEAQKFIREGD